jgi:hypothetical protein
LSLQRLGVPCVLLWALWQTAGGTALAQTEARLHGPIDDTQIVRIEHSTHPLARTSQEIGRVETDKKLDRLILVLWPSAIQEQELKTLMGELHNPKSGNYHHWLTAAEYGARFGVADADLENVREWLERSGFQVTKIGLGKRSVEFGGTSAQVENAFHTELHYYLVDGKKHIANSADIALPAELANMSPGVASLNNFKKITPRKIVGGQAGRNAQGQKVVTTLTPSLTAAGANSTFTYYLAPGDFAAIYDTSTLLSAGLDGTGISIAVVAQSNIELTDVQVFRQIFGLKSNDPNILLSGPDPGLADPSDANEAMLDTEWAGAVAPGATIDLVIAGSTATTNGVDLAAAYAIENQVAPILTYSYGACEQALGTAGNAFYNNLWQQAAAQGITVLVATGDNGAAGCDNPNAGMPATQGLAVSGTASTPYNVAVGGTEFAEGTSAATYWSATNSASFASAIGYIPEASWNESCDPGQPTSATNCEEGTGSFSLLAGGGGTSTVYAKPSWQAGNGVPADGQRDVPDVALAAAADHDDIVYCTSLGGAACQVNGQEVTGLTLVGGTSAAAPAMAGILALVEQKNGAYQGQINNVLYKLAQSSSCDASKQTNPTAHSACIFYDVTTGGNAVPCAGGSPGCSSTVVGVNGILNGQSAGPGYDLVTGLGSVNAANLANNWKTATLAISQTSLTMTGTSFVHGTAANLSGIVAPGSGTGTPSGNVLLKTDAHGNMPDTITLTSGAFTAAISDLPGGQYNLSAHYDGDETFAASDSASVSVNVTPEASTTTLSLNGLQNGSVGYGSPVTVAVKVAGLSSNGVATGTISLLDGVNAVGTYPLASDGGVSIPTGGGGSYAFAPGMHALTATYVGDNSFSPSTSSALNFSVTQGTPFVVVGVNTNTATVGQTIGVHAVVSGFGSVPATGAVQFTDNGTPVGSSLPLQTGGFFGTQAQAATLLTNLQSGQHVIGANYLANGDVNYMSVVSGDPKNELTQTVAVTASSGSKTTTTTLTATTLPVNLGDTASFAVAVKPTTATGTVTLWDAVGPRSAAAATAGGTATISVPWPQGGTTAVYAIYSGDAANASSTSTPVSFTVKTGVPNVILTAPGTATTTQQVSLNASVSGSPANTALAYPTGLIEFWDSVNGAAAQILSVQSLTVGAGNIAVYASRFKFAAGTHALHAHYRGDNNWQAADSPSVTVTASVTGADFTVGLLPNPLAFTAGTAGSSIVTITPVNGFTGAVNLTCGTGGTFAPAGYTCGLASSVTLSGGAATTPLNLTPSATAASAVKVAANSEAAPHWWAVSFAGGVLLLSLAFCGLSDTQKARNFACVAGLGLCVSSLVLGCGGSSGSSGGGGGGGPVATTTSLTSTALKVGFSTPIQFNVTVNASVTPTGNVQLFDNGQTFGSAVPVNSGIATFATGNLPVGVHVITAQYLGSTNTLPSSSAPITQVITGPIQLQITAASGSGISHTANLTVIVN